MRSSTQQVWRIWALIQKKSQNMYHHFKDRTRGTWKVAAVAPTCTVYEWSADGSPSDIYYIYQAGDMREQLCY